MRNLQYEIRISRKTHNNITMTMLILVTFSMNQGLISGQILEISDHSAAATAAFDGRGGFSEPCPI